MKRKKVERIKALSREGKFCNCRQFWDDNPYFSLCYTVYCTENSELRPLLSVLQQLLVTSSCASPKLLI